MKWEIKEVFKWEDNKGRKGYVKERGNESKEDRIKRK
jgi:hypothetical protein